MQFNPVEIIRKKRDGGKLTKNEIEVFIGGAVKKDIPDYQVSAFLMTVFFNGMDPEETSTLTKAMMNSGEVVNFNDRTIRVDKHSTGGVGDKVSLILAPLVAATGVQVPMVAGRGLGHTGGTIDKLEAIPGFKTSLSTTDFIEQVKTHGLALMGQTEKFVPADKLIYALRDVTSTVECIPLITASILSKKAAEGIQGLVLDLKTGTGAFMEKMKDAEALAKAIISVGAKLGLKVRVLITDMNQPLGEMVGHSLEVLECIDIMQGRGPKDLRDLTLELAAHMIVLGKKQSLASARKLATEALDSGKAFEKFKEMCRAQGATIDFGSAKNKLTVSSHTIDVPTSKSGYVESINTRELGMILVELGGGRKKTTDQIDFGVGYHASAKIGDALKKGQSLMKLYYNPDQLRKNHLTLEEAVLKIQHCYKISSKKVKRPLLIKKVIQ